MDSTITATALYVAAKLFGYSCWAYLGVRLLRGKAGLAQGLLYGVIRLLLGVFFGVMVFLFYHPDAGRSLLLDYVAIYAPLRWLEWSLLAKIIDPKRKGWLWTTELQLIAWRAGGIILSFGIDFLHPAAVDDRFCVGRCLC